MATTESVNGTPIGSGGGGLSTVHTDGATTMGDGSAGNPVAVGTSGIGTTQLAALAVTAAKVAGATLTDAQVAAANKDGVAAVASLRTLGTGAQQAAAGNDARLSDARTPSTAGTNGGVMYYAGGAWASLGAGTAGQSLLSGGAGAPTWGTPAFVAGLTIRTIDANTASVVSVLTVTHNSATGAAGVATELLLQGSDSTTAEVDYVSIRGTPTVVTHASFACAMDLYVRTGGAAKSLAARLWPSGGFAIGAAATTDPGAGSFLVPNATYYNALSSGGGVFGLVALSNTNVCTFGNASLNNNFIATGSHSFLVGGSAAFSHDASRMTLSRGLATKRTTVADAAYTILATDYRIALTSITAARVWTGPAAAVVGQELVFCDESGNASATLKVTFAPASGTVDGAASLDVITSARGSKRVYFDGTNWHTSA